jgi:hypothetical protein
VALLLHFEWTRPTAPQNCWIEEGIVDDVEALEREGKRLQAERLRLLREFQAAMDGRDTRALSELRPQIQKYREALRVYRRRGGERVRSLRPMSPDS